MRNVLFLFGQLTDEDVDWMGRVGEVLRVAAGEVLIEQGRPAAALYVLLSGRVSVAVAGLGRVAVMGDGEVFGEMAFVDALPPAATVRAESPSIVLAVDRAALARHIDADPGFGCRFYRALAMFLSDRLRAARRPNGDAAAPEGELDGNVLDAVSEAGTRFQRLSQTLLAEGGDAR